MRITAGLRALLCSCAFVLLVGASVTRADIHGSGGQDIHGSGIADIHGSGGQDIHGSGGQDIHGSGIADIHGSGGQDIHGSGIADIHGSGGQDIHGSGIADIHGSGISRLVLSAPVDTIDTATGVFTSLGQNVLASSDMLATLSPGDFVDVYGSVIGGGLLYADFVEVSESPYVLGADTLFVVGLPNSVDLAGASASLGELTIDFSAAMYSGKGVSSGLVTFVGIQSTESGLLFADIAATD